jgi:pectate lyase-like protein
MQKFLALFSYLIATSLIGINIQPDRELEMFKFQTGCPPRLGTKMAKPNFRVVSTILQAPSHATCMASENRIPCQPIAKLDLRSARGSRASRIFNSLGCTKSFPRAVLREFRQQGATSSAFFTARCAGVQDSPDDPITGGHEQGATFEGGVRRSESENEFSFGSRLTAGPVTTDWGGRNWGDDDAQQNRSAVQPDSYALMTQAGPSGDRASGVTLNQSVARTRSYVVTDVTTYGAKGDGQTDDTSAIQKAIDVACVATNGGRGEIYFPPGYYLVSQKQTPTPITVPDLSVAPTCSGLYFYGGSNNERRMWPQFAQAPQAVIQVRRGANPNGSPVFLLEQGSEPGATQGGQQSKFENLSINGYNEAVWVLSAVNVRFKNCALSVPTTGAADNAALKVTDTFWFYFTDGSLQTSSTGVPVAMFTGEDYSFETSPSVGLVTFRDVITTGGPFFYDQRQSTANQPGNFIFDNVTMEQGGSGTPFLSIKCEKGSVCNMWGPLMALNDSVSDGNPGAPFLEISGFNLVDAHFVNAQTNAGHTIQVDGPSRVYNCTITGGLYSTRNAVTSSGKTVTGCTQTNGDGGIDLIGPRNYKSNNDYDTYFTDVRGNESKFSGLPLRAAKEGDDNISVAVDPAMGLLSGPGDPIGGYDTSFARTGAQEQSLSLAQADAPSSLAAAGAADGSLSVGISAITTITRLPGSQEQVFCAAGCHVRPGQSVRISGNSNPAFNTTVIVRAVLSSQLWTFSAASSPGDGTGGTIPTSYFYFVEANLEPTKCLESTSTGPSQETAVTPTKGYQTAELTWTASTGTGIAGYCIWRGTKYPLGENVYFYVPGSNSTSFADVGETGTSGTPSHVNNTFPKDAQYVFGLAGQAFTSGNMVGHLRLNNGKSTIIFSPPWKSTPACITNDETTAGSSKAIPTAATLTIIGGVSDIVDYVCFGNAR